MLKIMDIDSYQYRIYHALLRQVDTFADQNLFPCVLPPLAILDTPHNYAVVSMPMYVLQPCVRPAVGMTCFTSPGGPILCILKICEQFVKY